MAIPDKNSFRQSLMSVSEGLSDEDLLHLVHLCRGVITRKEADSISTGFELFELLEVRGKLSPQYLWYLADLLLVINQNCLLDHVGLGKISESEHEDRRCQIKPYRLCLAKLAMEVGSEDFKALKLACECLKEEITQFYQLIMFLESRGKISQKKGVDFLFEAFEKAGLTKENEKLIKLIDSFKVQLANEDDHYSMTSKTKGVCVIINNVDFTSEGHTRFGSDQDAGRLSREFKRRSFKVEVHKNLSSKDIISTLQDVSQRDHWLYDCFICCVLSHGSLGSVFGTDNIAVNIQSLLDKFSVRSCPSLEDKPKVFFFQACQGQNYERGSSASLSSGSLAQSDVVIDDTAPSESDLGPDFLLGYATTPGNKSFRSTKHGSWYIQELIDCLKEYATREDILSILTMVNSDVAEKEGFENMVPVKQIPRPTFTLTKRLFLG